MDRKVSKKTGKQDILNTINILNMYILRLFSGASDKHNLYASIKYKRHKQYQLFYLKLIPFKQKDRILRHNEVFFLIIHNFDGSFLKKYCQIAHFGL